MRKIRWPFQDAVLGRGTQRLEPPARIVVGLGNPGAEYVATRHNVGFWCVDRLAGDHSIAFSRRQRVALIGEGVIEGHRVVLAKPRTFVNRSGEAITHLLGRYGVSPQRLLVVQDELDLPPGKVRLRPKGSGGGHKGVDSVIAALGTQDFPRLRIGIGRPPPGSDQIEYVLGAMSEEERRVADEAVARAAQAVEALIADGIDAAMSSFN